MVLSSGFGTGIHRKVELFSSLLLISCTFLNTSFSGKVNIGQTSVVTCQGEGVSNPRVYNYGEFYQQSLLSLAYTKDLLLQQALLCGKVIRDPGYGPVAGDCFFGCSQHQNVPHSLFSVAHNRLEQGELYSYTFLPSLLVK